MTNFKTPGLFLAKILAALLAVSTLLLIVGVDLFPFMPPVDLLLAAGFGALLFLAVVLVHAALFGYRQPRSAAEGK
ncbi:MAG: hypothetical protein J7549_07670 [Variovorax sp.]|nr:hypothetical protein [Variovorax sp.]